MKVLLLLSVTTMALATSPCPPGAFLSVFKEKCFQPVNLQTDFRNAQKICAMFGGNLASVNNQYDNYLLTYKSSGTFWVGGVLDKGVWKWENGQQMSYTNWAQNEPKNQPNYCVKIIKNEGNPLKSDQKWVSLNCEQWAYFACETKPYYVPLEPNCPEGFECFDGHAYGVFVPSRTWNDAEAHCQSLGGHLASVHSAEEEAFLEYVVGKRFSTAWIGARLPSHGKVPDWSDGSKADFVK
ncbi:hypothetical protein QR680_018628 [Steinernema hermaphroditum]|uniref:C-type lectin domain-containing protein n=1 Tax=Steinernema hermaphroditum TaxID=289476 RepID=A0AA39HKN7_9BILA|nr:hypothetical protein QR680_018628 [Steinernema hermaphroditum]